MEILTGDIVRLKKKHPCGSFDWEVLRSGADFRLKCCGCEHQVMMARKLVEKNTRGLRKKEESEKASGGKRKNLLRSVKKYRLRKNLRRYFLVNTAEL